jgi:hypothetical protein
MTNTGQEVIENNTFTQAQYLSTQPQETRTLTEAMKSLKKRRVPGRTTGCSSNQEPCIEEKQRVRQPAVRSTQRSKKRTNIYVHTHTSMHVGMYDCMRSESESELASQLSGILRKTNKQTSIRVCLCMHVCMRSESESESHSSPPQCKGVRDLCMCVCARVCAGTILLISLLCLFVCRCIS